MGLRSGE